MDKAIIAMLLAILGLFLGIFVMCFMSIINATIFYYVWNILAPVYFVTFLPVVFMHISWWHCWLFMWLIGLVFGRFSSVQVKGDK